MIEFLNFIKKNARDSKIDLFEIKFKYSHCLWFILGSYISYKYYQDYIKFYNSRVLFENNFVHFNKKYSQIHYQTTKSAINLKGYPDQGDWLYSKEMDNLDLEEFIENKENYFNSMHEFNYIMSFYIIGGIFSPFLMSINGIILLYNKNKTKKKEETYNKYIIGTMAILSIFGSFKILKAIPGKDLLIKT